MKEPTHVIDQVRWRKVGESYEDRDVIRLSEQPDYIVALTRDELDVIIGCLFVAENGGEANRPFYEDGTIYNGTGLGGTFLNRFPPEVIDAALTRLGAPH